ncbi:hypothetical protein T492DRAFT_465714, partial [Pavlovales sp. CCMP2436]
LNLLGGGVRRPVLRTTAYTRRPRYQTSRALALSSSASTNTKRFGSTMRSSSTSRSSRSRPSLSSSASTRARAPTSSKKDGSTISDVDAYLRYHSTKERPVVGCIAHRSNYVTVRISPRLAEQLHIFAACCKIICEEAEVLRPDSLSMVT